MLQTPWTTWSQGEAHGGMGGVWVRAWACPLLPTCSDLGDATMPPSPCPLPPFSCL